MAPKRHGEPNRRLFEAEQAIADLQTTIAGHRRRIDDVDKNTRVVLEGCCSVEALFAQHDAARAYDRVKAGLSEALAADLLRALGEAPPQAAVEAV